MSQISSPSYLERLLPFGLFGYIKQERVFLLLIMCAFLAASLSYPYASIAMWVGFAFAGYSAIANDSIQTIGTFLASNQDKKWWVLWLYIGGIFLIVVTVSFFTNNGDVSSGRLMDLDSDGNLKFPKPESYTFLQVAAPIFLLILTRLRMPVSTTFLLLSSFTVTTSGVTSVLFKSLQGYFIAFALGLIVWLLVTRLSKKYFVGEPSKKWMVTQWIISGSLWAVWIMQDAANIAVYLPRALDLVQFLAFASLIFFGLGILFYLKGDKIQEIVTEKSEVTDVRSATIIDFVYTIILIYKLMGSTVPLSTTWVFLGLLAGREIGMSIMDSKGIGKPMPIVLKMVGKDMGYALIGLAVSVALALSINQELLGDVIETLGF